MLQPAKTECQKVYCALTSTDKMDSILESAE